MRVLEIIELLILIMALEESEYFHLVDSGLPDKSGDQVGLP
jgi:hypothetical protein